MSRVDGGPAFPHTFQTLAAPLNAEPGRLYPAEQVTMVCHGMSTRDYFAAHAPAMPDWFNWKNPEPFPAAPRADKELSQEHYQQWQGLGDYLEDHEVAPEVLAFRERRDDILAKQATWNQHDSFGKFTAWRWAYADAMVQGCAR